jgi:hypothetical protein
MSKGFVYAGDLNGHKNPIVRKFVVPNATAIERGEPIDFTVGTGVVVLAAPTDFDDPIAGVSMQEKGANDGVTEIEVSYSPTAIYKHKASKVYTLTGGSTTTAVDSSLQPQTNNFFKEGAIKIVNCVADPSLNGKVVKISESTGATGTLTLAETLPVALASGDTILLVPGKFAEGYFGYDLTSDAMAPDYDAIGGETLQFLYSNTDTLESFWRFRLHKYAQHPVAL